ncbi:beta-glucosidase [Lacrimispora xylanisolvens]|uniref:Beta-glucosidase n=1 Tax=Lacrimispora xylanisolvens TaxID=384636 RepID=A0A2S6HW15_9FIRM|nr:glycoside hydrolase family 3 C-terminal domain-containing protein [Hungatella xylanolytica]PPK82097.1 beta-glucosidase [Hungatella xylanolytica]
MNRKEARKRAEQLVANMTLEEKASQLRYDAPPIRRLNIPAYNWWNEALHGVARAGTATSFPQAIGLAAAFDEELVHEIAEVIAEEGRAKYNAFTKQDDRDIYKGLTFWSPNVNIFRDPRWGRGQETYGEDPYLSSRLGVSYIKGLQGESETMKAAACVKHFAVHSGPEALRHEFNAEVSPKDLRETYLPAFEAAVKEGKSEAVMGAYNRTNGEPCCASKTLMQDILRGEWGFEGHYVSDCWAIRDFHERHLISPDAKTSAAMALNAGCDLNCGNTYLHILNAYQHGLVTEEAITESCTRLFTTRYLLGLFDDNEFDSIPYEKVECKKHLELSERAARESMVLLKNNGILPLDKEAVKTIGVIGPNANSRAALIGNYHGTSSEYITILEGIKAFAKDDIRVLYSDGCNISRPKTEALAFDHDRISEAVIVAEHSDVVVLCLGLNELLEGEEGDQGNQYASGDKESLLLPESQRKLMEALSHTGTPVVLCMMAGSDIDLSIAKENYDAIIQAWYPGARGGKAFTELLFGLYSPSGKLCVTFYDPECDLPDFTDYSMKNRTYRYLESKPQYPFGFGLTYGQAKMCDAYLAMDEMEIEAVVENIGDRAVEEVIQVYVKVMDSEFAPLHPRLCGFKRVALNCGEKKSVKIKLDQRAFMVVNENGEYIKDGNHVELYAGFSQPDETSIQLMGCKPVKLTAEI